MLVNWEFNLQRLFCIFISYHSINLVTGWGSVMNVYVQNINYK